MKAPNVIFLHGPVASGKLTIVQELAALTGFALFHNHLTVDLLLALFPFGSPQFSRNRERIWLDLVTDAAAAGTSLIFTFAPERTVCSTFPQDLKPASKLPVGAGTLSRSRAPTITSNAAWNPNRATLSKNSACSISIVSSDSKAAFPNCLRSAPSARR